MAGKATMNGADIKKAAINKAKAVAQAANGNGGKKRRKGQDHDPGPRGVHRQVAGLPALERRERRVPTDKPQQ